MPCGKAYPAHLGLLHRGPAADAHQRGDAEAHPDRASDRNGRNQAATSDLIELFVRQFGAAANQFRHLLFGDVVAAGAQTSGQIS